MNATIEFPALSLVDPEPAMSTPPTGPQGPASPAPTATSIPVTGRRWSDGAGTYAPVDPNAAGPWRSSGRTSSPRCPSRPWKAATSCCAP
ncbi:hypothetical protein HK414_11540 [Ramlibacter terrae]|uniref:Uncharacterized protein n=1 Tax=Ramlibacter terrae TaxID=2732511 RepID=A0ABX6P2E4_9BURK|nr:hypothetical protein HK414_11540 [Ramlibacter terrae]